MTLSFFLLTQENRDGRVDKCGSSGRAFGRVERTWKRMRERYNKLEKKRKKEVQREGKKKNRWKLSELVYQRRWKSKEG